MRRVHWLVTLCTLFASGCLCPGPSGSCRSSSNSFFIPPAQRFSGTQTQEPKPQAAKCQPPIYLTLAKYWPSLDEWATNSAARSCARRILFKQQWETLRLMPGSYKDGFVQAFLDVANGGNGTVPPVPPPEYWNAMYRSEAGQKVANRWFDGYREGAAMALVNLDSMRHVASSPDWQVPERDTFACANSCSTGACPTSPAQAMSGHAPQQALARNGMPPGMPYGSGMAPPAMGFDPRMASQPYGGPVPYVPNAPLAPNFPPPGQLLPGQSLPQSSALWGSAPSPNGPQNEPPISVIGPPFSAGGPPTPAGSPGGRPTNAPTPSLGQPGYSKPSAPGASSPQSGLPSSGLTPGYSSGSGTSSPPSSLPPEGIVY